MRQQSLLRAIKEDVRRDIKAAKRLRLHWRGGLGVLAGGLLSALIFDHFGAFELARPTTAVVAVVALTIFVKRNLVWESWFWVTMTILVVFHAGAIASVHWGTRWVPAPAIAGAMSIDFLGMILVIEIVGEFIARRHRPSGGATPPNQGLELSNRPRAPHS